LCSFIVVRVVHACAYLFTVVFCHDHTPPIGSKGKGYHSFAPRHDDAYLPAVRWKIMGAISRRSRAIALQPSECAHRHMVG
jgi:hypothetical protein